MSQEEGSEHTPSATPSRSGSSGSGEEESGTPAAQNAERQQDSGPLLPHQLIPAHIKDKEKIDVRRGLLKTATKELGGLLRSLQGLQDSSLQANSSCSEELAAAVLCSKLMKRRTLLCCKADTQQPDCRPLRPLQVLCEAKVSAASPAFIKCSCDSCTTGGGSSGSNFNSVREYAEHARQVCGPETVVVEAQSELSWQELLTFLTQDTSLTTDMSSHMWYCLFCEQQLPGAPLRGCDACQLACHGACYTRTYGQPLAQGPDGRVLCLSCQDPSLRTIKEPQQAPMPASKAGTVRYTLPLMASEVFRRETNPSHFEKGTYDFWGPKQAKLMDDLVLPVDSPEAQAATAAATTGDKQQQQHGSDSTPAAAPLPGAVAANGTAGTEREAAADAAANNQHDQLQLQQQQGAGMLAGAGRPKPTHVLIARDPDGRIHTVEYEFGKHHKTHGENRKLWVVPLLEQLGMQFGDLLIAVRDPTPLLHKHLQQQQQQGQEQQQQQQWMKVLGRCDKVLQLHIVRKSGSSKEADTAAVAAAPAAADKAAAPAAVPRSAAAAVRSALAAGGAAAKAAAAVTGVLAAAGSAAAAPAAAALGNASNIYDKPIRTSQSVRPLYSNIVVIGSEDDATDDIPAPAVVQAALTSSCLFNAVATTKPGYGPRNKAAAYYAAAEAVANEVMTKPAYKLVQQQGQEQRQAYRRALEDQARQQEQQQLQQQMLQQLLQERFAAEQAAGGQLPGAAGYDDDDDDSDSDSDADAGYDSAAAGGGERQVKKRRRRRTKAEMEAARAAEAAALAAGLLPVKKKRKRRTKAEMEAARAAEAAAAAAGLLAERKKRKRRTKAEMEAARAAEAEAAGYWDEDTDGSQEAGALRSSKRQRKPTRLVLEAAADAAAVDDDEDNEDEGYDEDNDYDDAYDGEYDTAAAAAAPPEQQEQQQQEKRSKSAAAGKAKAQGGGGSSSSGGGQMDVQQLAAQLAAAQQQIAALQQELGAVQQSDAVQA